jgi:hypothetical protein
MTMLPIINSTAVLFARANAAPEGASASLQETAVQIIGQGIEVRIGNRHVATPPSAGGTEHNHDKLYTWEMAGTMRTTSSG